MKEKTYQVLIMVTAAEDEHLDVLEAFLEGMENTAYHTENELSYSDIEEYIPTNEKLSTNIIQIVEGVQNILNTRFNLTEFFEEISKVTK